jgi:hypothetical protein
MALVTANVSKPIAVGPDKAHRLERYVDWSDPMGVAPASPTNSRPKR